MAGHRGRARSDPGLTRDAEGGSTMDTASERHNPGASNQENDIENDEMEVEVQEEQQQVEQHRARRSDDSQVTLRPVKKTRTQRRSNSSDRTVIKAAKRARDRLKKAVKRILGRQDPNVDDDTDGPPPPTDAIAHTANPET